MPKDPDHAQGTPLRREPELVKKQPGGEEVVRPPSNFRRHLQGYELGLVTVGMVLTFALLAVPRASEPETLPLPQVDRSEARRSEAREQELRASAERDGLPFEVRAVGEALRGFGRTSAQGFDAAHEQQDIAERVKIALGKAQAPLLLQLRAVQTGYFLSALSQFERDGKASPDLNELGGEFVSRAQHSGWFDESRHCLADATTLGVLFRLRWATLIGMQRAFPFAPSLNDWRVYYRFSLLHPERSSAPASASSDDEARLKLVIALSHRDPEYPENFAKGYLLYRLGDREAAAAAYRAQLGQSDSGPYALLARNYLIYALQGVPSE
jgi:hypothetical protein